MREVYQKVYRRSDFSFFQDDKEYTTRVINVTFKYNNKRFNKMHSNFYVRFGYCVTEDQLSDCTYIKDGKLIAIKINERVDDPISNDLLDDAFYYDNGQYNVKANIGILNTVADLRTHLYENGFYCDGIHYVRFKRSSGSSRVGKCLFIDERLYYRMHKWEDCGVKIEKIKNPDLAAYEAYIALTLSSIIDTITINPENILVIDDFESVFKDDVIATRFNGGHLVSEPDNVEIKNSIWDGQSLLDKSAFGKYEQYGMLLLRNRFFKSCCFNTNIQQFFIDNGITSVSQLNGFTLAENITDVKLITTPSSIKYLKFGSLEQWLENLEPTFGVVKHEKPTHYFDGKMVQTHYQLLNTLQMSYDEVEKFMKPSLDYIRQLHTNPAVLRYHIQYPNQEFRCDPLKTKYDIVFRLLGLNEKFTQTKMYYDFKINLIKSFKKNLRKGHVLVNGNYSTLFGNPYEMLLSSIGKFDGQSILGIGNVHSKRFRYNKTLLGSRSPHTVIGNIYLPTNIADDNIDRYFNLTNEIVCINSIRENTLQKLSGCD